MAEITASLVKELRERTGAGMMDCKKALTEANGDIELAIENMRKSGAIKAAKKAGNVAADGVIKTKIDGNYGIILEVNCQTDFVAKDAGFQAFADKVLDAAVAGKITDVEVLKAQFEEERVALVAKIGENINIRRVAALEGDVLGSYQHGARIGVLVAAKGADEELVKHIAMHVAASKPEFIKPEDVSAEVVEKEYQVQLDIAMQSGKPKEIAEKMVEGRMKKFTGEVSLTGQPFVMEPSKTVGQLLKEHNNPRQGWISPDVFIPIAEEHHLIVPLTHYVMAETIRQHHVFPMSSQFHVGINVAPSHFRRGVLIKDLNQYWFSAHPIQQLILEITERDALLDVDYRIARELHRKNVKLAIDDFGTGNSSFSWLETLRPDVLKIDKSFTAAIGSDAVNSTVTDIIIALGQRLNIELVAEGVETQEQAKYLRRHGVHILQGYLYAQPMPLRDFPKWLAGSQPPPARHNGHITPIMSLR